MSLARFFRHGLLAQLCLGFGQIVVHAAASAEALNRQLTNTLPLKGGPVLYYNGSGPVPPKVAAPISAPQLAALTPQETEDLFFAELQAIRLTSSLSADNNCTRCIAFQEVFHLAALTQSGDLVNNLLVRSCKAGGWTPRLRNAAATCEAEFAALGQYWARIFAKMSVATGDMQVFCAYQYGMCSPPETVLINENEWFSPKPADKMVAPKPSGQPLKILHMTDTHIDERYSIRSEAACSQYMCCRPESTNTKLFTTSANASVPASRFGYFYCDPPADLMLSSFLSMESAVGISNFSFALFTGDAVAHDNDDELSQAYVEYEEEITYQTIKAQLGNVPVYATLGNHDSLPQAYEFPNNILPSGSPTSWNHKLVTSLWQSAGWINASTASSASTHYGAYAVTTVQGLKIVALNSDFWYIDNVPNYVNYTNPDNSGMLQFLINELTASEAINQRVWIIAHVPTGYDTFSPLPNPTALFYSIIRRFSPATIAALFFGHTHEDQFNIYYDFNPSSLIIKNGTTYRNTSDINYSSPLNIAYIAPSLTPLTGYNAGWRYYTVDSATFSVLNTYTYFANMSNSNTWTTPIWEFEYDARSAYDPASKWPATEALNASFWHGVTSDMLNNLTVSALFGKLESKSSVLTAPCNTTTCAMGKVCNLRAASGALQIGCPGTVKTLFNGTLGGTR